MPQLPATPSASLRLCCWLTSVLLASLRQYCWRHYVSVAGYVSFAGVTTSVLLAKVSVAGLRPCCWFTSVLLASLRQCCWLRSALLAYVSVAGLRSRCCGLPQLPRTDTRHYVSVPGLRQRCWLTSAVLWSTAVPSH